MDKLAPIKALLELDRKESTGAHLSDPGGKWQIAILERDKWLESYLTSNFSWDHFEADWDGQALLLGQAVWNKALDEVVSLLEKSKQYYLEDKDLNSVDAIAYHIKKIKELKGNQEGGDK